jgi:hypothetical protein
MRLLRVEDVTGFVRSAVTFLKVACGFTWHFCGLRIFAPQRKTTLAEKIRERVEEMQMFVCLGFLMGVSMQYVKIMQDYGALLWHSAPSSEMGPIEPNKLPISQELCLKVNEMVDRHYNSLDWSNPGGPLVWSKEEEKQYTLELYRIVKRLVEELSENNVSVKVHETLYKSLSEHVPARAL